MTPSVQERVLSVEGLEVVYTTRSGPVRAVRDVSIGISPGKVLGLVGESGCGKSTLAFAVMKYMPPNAKATAGRILFRGRDILRMSGRELNRLRGNDMAMVYQDPMASLNPSLRIGPQLTEVLIEHAGSGAGAARAACLRMLERVRMPDPPAIMERYCHQLSGGQQQRVLIAMALLTNPALLIMDEPTTGLDVTVEAEILDLIGELKRELNTAILFISHSFGVISRVADRVAVMYAGELVEQAPVRDIFRNPRHPYTAGLLGCVPKISSAGRRGALSPIRGRVPALHETPAGCAFASRCDRARDRCRREHPGFQQTAEGHPVRCYYPDSADSPGLQPLPATPDAAELPSAADAPVLQIEGLKVYYQAKDRGLAGMAGRHRKGFVKAVDDVSLAADGNSTLGIVGESGCGKTTLAKCIVGLVPPNDGKLGFAGMDAARIVEHRPVATLRELQMIFQNPDSTLNPKRTAGEAVARPLQLFGTVPSTGIRNEVVRLLEAVRLGEEYYDRLPAQLSGGEKQRVALARAFAGRPSLVLCDEPLSALDVSVQAAIMNLLQEFQRQYGTTIVFISHDLSAVYQLCSSVAVMYLGQICETGPVEALFEPPYHPYTEALLSAVPIPDPTLERNDIRLSGTVPSALDPPTGCRFHTRCPRKIGPVCEQEAPPCRGARDGHRIYCHIDMEELQTVKPVFGSVE
ncbi:MAG: ABC transporter ATP-binding protein [Gammaproteobacteria bacterium]|nr:ABC transporter ATP-binding protein [Gammaproteobacteria bacterium]MDE0367064.1 ABC transporter ATP-binding protein [Gammaproteobacteria bacterium]